MKTILQTCLCSVSAAVILSACGSNSGTGLTAGQSNDSAMTTNEVARLTVGSHKVSFFAAPNGLTAIGESGPIGSTPVTGQKLANQKLSDAYRAVAAMAGADTTVPKAITDAENRPVVATKIAALPTNDAGKSAKSGGGPTLYDDSDQIWFRDNYCPSGWECVQGWDWANSDVHLGVGYMTIAYNGSEAQGARTFGLDYWDGSSWQSLGSADMPPNSGYWFAAGDGGQYPAANDPQWYFKSEVLPNNIDYAEVSLSDYTDPYVPPTVGQTRLCGTQSGPIVCLRGHDFTANGQVNLQYANLPNFPNPYNDTRTADSTGALNSDDYYDRGALAYCSQSQLSGQVTLTLTDASTNQSSTIQFLATQFCANGATTGPACVPIYDGARYFDYTCP